MKTFYSELVLLNENEWILHINEVLKLKDSKSQEELLEDMVTFDFKFTTISQENPSS